MTRPRQSLARAVGVAPIRLTATTQWLIVSFFLAVPLGLRAAMMFPSGSLGFQTLISPASTLAGFLEPPSDPRLGGGGPLTVLLDLTRALGKFMEIAWATNIVYFAALIFAGVLIFAGKPGPQIPPLDTPPGDQ
jgi:hypothetical protein